MIRPGRGGNSRAQMPVCGRSPRPGSGRWLTALAPASRVGIVAVEGARVPICGAGVVAECPVYRALTYGKRAPDAARARELAPRSDASGAPDMPVGHLPRVSGHDQRVVTLWRRPQPRARWRRPRGGAGPGAEGLACRPGSVSGAGWHRRATIHLGRPLPVASCGLPAHSGGQPSNVRASLTVANDFLTLLLVGFAEPCRSPGTLVVSYTTVSPSPSGGPDGCLFSVALSRRLPRVGVTHHRALWSPDLPRPVRRRTAAARPAPPLGQDSPSLAGVRSSA